MSEEQKEWLSVAEFTQILNQRGLEITDKTIYWYIGKEKLRVRRPTTRKIQVHISEVERLLQENEE